MAAFLFINETCQLLIKKGHKILLFQACSKEKSGIFSYHVGIESPKGNSIEDESTAVAIGEALASHQVGDGGDNLEKRFLALMDVSLSTEPGASVDFKKLWKPWRKALIIKVFGRSVSFKVLEQRIRDICKLERDCEIIDLESGFFLTRFYSKRDYLHVLNNGPWVILGHYLTLTKWRQNFRPSLEKVSSTLVWIRFPEVPIEFFEESVLLQMGNLVGRAVKVDDTTMEVSRGRFARVCVEIDLSKKFLEFLCWAIHNWWNMKVFIKFASIVVSMDIAWKDVHRKVV